MPVATVNGVDIYYEEAGAGFPLVLCHEFAGDMRSWELQVRHFARRYRVITFNYRGYPPSSVPSSDDAYSHDQLVDDLKRLLVHIGIERMHLVGHGTGGNLVLEFAIGNPDSVAGLVIAGSGAGSVEHDSWISKMRAFADEIERRGTAAIIENIKSAPQRVIFARKDPKGWETFLDQMADFSPAGCVKLIRNALARRKTVFELQDGIEKLSGPVLVVVGDQDAPAFDASRFVTNHAPFGGLAVLPMCGHTLILEEPALFNRCLSDYLAAVDSGRWGAWARSR